MEWQPASHSMTSNTSSPFGYLDQPPSGNRQNLCINEQSVAYTINKCALSETTALESTSELSPKKQPSEKEIDAIFSALLASQWFKLNHFVSRRIGNKSDAEDITQQTFVEAIASYSKFKGTSQISTWLYGIALNLIRNYLSRSPHRKHIFESDDVLETIQVNSDGPEESLAFTELVEIIHHEVSRLPYEMQQVFIPIVFEDVPYEEVALLLMIPVGTVRSRLSRARDILRKKLEECHIVTHLQRSKNGKNKTSKADFECDLWCRSEINHIIGDHLETNSQISHRK